MMVILDSPEYTRAFEFSQTHMTVCIRLRKHKKAEK